jgi:hypothetical protein
VDLGKVLRMINKTNIDVHLSEHFRSLPQISPLMRNLTNIRAPSHANLLG